MIDNVLIFLNRTEHITLDVLCDDGHVNWRQVVFMCVDTPAIGQPTLIEFVKLATGAGLEHVVELSSAELSELKAE